MTDLYWAPFSMPNGNSAVMGTREDTVDFDVCMSSITQDEYLLGDRSLSGWAFDIGAHIGAVSIALALANPDLKVVAVEIVPENVALLQLNINANNVADRVFVEEIAAGGPDELSRTCYMHHRSHPVASPEYVAKHRFIGNSFWSEAYGGAFDSDAVEIPTTSLGALMKKHVIDELDFLKIDCEGCEWAFLDSPDIGRVKSVIGEYHWDYAPQGDSAKHKKGAKLHKRAGDAQAELHRIFDATHDLEVADHPTIGLFTAVLK